MKLGISILFVENVSLSKSFFVDKLGFSLIPHFSSDTFLALKVENCLIGIQDIKTTNLVEIKNFKAGSSELGFEVTEVEKLWHEFKEKGLELSELENKPFGRVFYMLAPEGHNLSFYQIPN